MKPIVITGARGRMATLLQEICRSRQIPFKVFGSKKEDREISDFTNCRAVIDFSLPEAMPEIVKLAQAARIPLVSGTTGFKEGESAHKLCAAASKDIPILWDSNFSFGIEIFSKVAELLATLPLQDGIHLTDVHHAAKRDAPSGTALKLKKRIQDVNSKMPVSIDSVRFGHIPGEHIFRVSLQDETLEFIHRASSRRPFADGALKALEWLEKQKPGIYSMKDLFA